MKKSEKPLSSYEELMEFLAEEAEESEDQDNDYNELNFNDS